MREFLLAIVPDKADQYLLTIGAALGAVGQVLFGDFSGALQWLIVMTCADWLLGTVAALVRHEWNSDAGTKGIFRKIALFFFVALAHGVDEMCAGLPTGFSFMSVSIAALGLTEAGSLIENVDRMGLGGYIPPIIRRGMKALQKKADETLGDAEDKQ